MLSVWSSNHTTVNVIEIFQLLKSGLIKATDDAALVSLLLCELLCHSLPSDIKLTSALGRLACCCLRYAMGWLDAVGVVVQSYHGQVRRIARQLSSARNPQAAAYIDLIFIKR